MSKASSAEGRRNRLAALLAALVMAGFSFTTGYRALDTVPTGRYSENITLAEAKLMSQGEHRYGIVEYTHFPNGPIYVAALLTRFELEVNTMRLVPVVVMATSVGWLVFALWLAATSAVARGWTLLAIGELLLQPGVSQWQGALHEHSYVVSLTLVGLALSVVLTNRSSWILFPFGFVAGWTGYDWIPGQMTAVVLGRWLFHARNADASLGQVLVLATIDAIKFASGFAAAVLAHLLQLGLFFGSLDEALRDLLGSAAARAGADSALEINPEYGQRVVKGAARLQQWAEARPDFESTFGADYDAANPQRWRLPGIMLTFFLKPRWTSWAQLAGMLLAGTAVVGWALRDWLKTARPTQVELQRRAVVLVVSVLLAVVAGFAWCIVMPNHASDHIHIVPRHYFMAVAGFSLIPVLLVPLPRAQECAAVPSAGISWVSAVYALPLLSLALIVAYVFAALG